MHRSLLVGARLFLLAHQLAPSGGWIPGWGRQPFNFSCFRKRFQVNYSRMDCPHIHCRACLYNSCHVNSNLNFWNISSDILLFQAIPRIKTWKNFPRKRVHELFINIIHPKATINRFQSHANESYLLNILNDICSVHLIAVGNLSDYEYRDGTSHNGITCLDRSFEISILEPFMVSLSVKIWGNNRILKVKLRFLEHLELIRTYFERMTLQSEENFSLEIFFFLQTRLSKPLLN